MRSASNWVIVTCCIFLFLPVCLLSRPIAYKLTGNELLCEFTAVGPSKTTPGIYLVETNKQDNNVQLLIPYGMNPAWSPDHTRILYWYNSELWLWDIKKQQTYRVIDQYFIGILNEMKFTWMPNSQAIVYLYPSRPGASTTPFCSFLQGGGSIGIPLWDRDDVEQIGNISFSSDSKMAVYENVHMISGWGKVFSELRICNLPELKIDDNVTPSTEYTVIHDPILQDTICFNPGWQPNGNLIAFEAYNQKNRSRKIMLYDIQKKTVVELVVGKGRLELPYHESVLQNPNLHFLRWSPDGKNILALLDFEKSISYAGVPIIVIPIANDKIIPSYKGNGGIIFDVAWSPDSKQFASIRDCVFDIPLMSSDCSFLINDTKQSETGGVVRIPDGLKPVKLAW